jgi:hypothetical protein
MEAQTRKRWVVRFSFATMLFVISCVCGYLGGYRSGYKAGDGAWHYSTTYVMSYNVADLIAPPAAGGPLNKTVADFDHLIAVVHKAGEDQPQNECEIRPFPANLSLVVAGNGIVHRRVHAMLAELRKTLPHVDEEAVEVRGATTPIQRKS